ncbi:DHA2 family efflux MFS transporter permease subunit [Allobranchiibius sp. GilTou73]|uniref:DHA2 family efflux MFS transporter permease subunit n=1 Tax=Allobranchiibius sp. GilTou73 TaxID=2904523 RepID=UPI001F447DBF|nr:DHA2 family efflux MFS transporter permease subunit [Allobranchiibius sp. GilTou73]UIJ33448.1 DHA2 family efflux MFS transporter permease subunit [Allobranchiibius sp. GilTou73]
MRKWLPLLAICLGSFMLLIDVTIVNVALPAMATDLSSSFAALQWVIDAYALVLAALLLGFGSLADALGHRRTYVLGLVVFSVASCVCGAAVNPAMLIAARALQGGGGAAMFATTFGLLSSAYTGRDRGTAFGVWGAVSGAASAVGPVLGGVLTQTISWRWIFLVNAPIGVATVLMTLAVITAPKAGGHRRIDVAGTLVFAVAAGMLTFAITRAGDDGWASPVVLGCLVVAVLAFVAFLIVESRVAAPMITLSLFGRRVFGGTVGAAFALSFAGFGALTYAVIWAQTMLGLSPIQAGLVCLPLPVFSATLSPLSGRFMQQVPRGLAIGGGLGLIGAGGLLSAVLISIDANWPSLLPGLALIGIGCGVSVPVMAAAATSDVGDDRAGVASGAINTARQLGQALGIAVLGNLAAAAATSTLRGDGVTDPARTASRVIGGGAGAVLSRHADLARALQEAFAAGLTLAYVVSGAVALVAAVGAGWLVRTRRPAHVPDESTFARS